MSHTLNKNKYLRYLRDASDTIIVKNNKADSVRFIKERITKLAETSSPPDNKAKDKQDITTIQQLQSELQYNMYQSLKIKIDKDIIATHFLAEQIVLIHPSIAYSGNKRTKSVVPSADSLRSPLSPNYTQLERDELTYSNDATENTNEDGACVSTLNDDDAIVLEVKLLDIDMNPVVECELCTNRAKQRASMKTRQNAGGFALVIKNDKDIKIIDGSFDIKLRPTCCSQHHLESPFYFFIKLKYNGNVIGRAIFSKYVKYYSGSKKNSETSTIPKRSQNESEGPSQKKART